MQALRHRYLTPLFLSGVALLSGASCSRVSDAAGPRNVVLICLDTVRADHLGCYGYTRHETTPAIDELAARSIVYTRTSATAGWTKPSVPSFLTGTFPMQHGVYEGSSRDAGAARSDVLPEASRTLAEAFHEAGYHTAAFVKNAQLRKGLGFEQGFELYRDEAGDAREIRWRARDWLDEIQGEEPFFLYLHFLDAHWPYPVPEEYAARFTDPESIELFRTRDWSGLRDRINSGELELTSEQRDALLALYDGSLRFIDDQLALLFRDLERRGMAENTVVCIIADHGEEFLEHGRIGHGHGLFENLLHVPWILHVPGEGGRRVDTLTSLVDLYPTLLHAARLDERGDGPGVDRLADPDARTEILAEHKGKRSYEQSIRVGVRKLIREARTTETAAHRLGPADVPRLFAAGDAVELEIGGFVEGRLVAESIAVDDDPSSYPLEIKGHVAGLSGERFRLAGLPVELAPEHAIYGEVETPEGEPVTLHEGLPVKVKGDVTEDGTVHARRLKFYAEDADFGPEVRGRISSISVEDGDCTIALGPLTLVLADDAKIDAPGGGRPRLSRADVIRLIESWGPGESPEGFEIVREGYDLDADPGEQAPAFDAETWGPIEAIADRLSRSLLGRMVWSEEDRAELSEQDLEALRAIGYVH